ncbi:MAG: LysR substrate-binding domain-containing protein [Acidimicrobiia bacterium]|nr:LysR substrate-binding domain-containing protein [Acidimicrobiia bacterium]
MSIELRHLRAFVAVAEELNFTRAAERLFIAQQGLSSQIRQLEERVGARLFDRDTRSVALTAAGLALYDQAKALIEGADAAVAAAREADGHATRSLTVGFVVAPEHGSFAHVLAEFGSRHPDANLMIRFGDATDPSGGLRTGDADVAFVYGPFDDAGLERRHLFTEPVGAVMSADHPLAAVDPLDLEVFLDEPTFEFGTDDRTWRDYWMSTALRKGKAPKIVAQFRALDGLVEAIRARLGVHTGTRSLAEMGGSSLLWKPVEGLVPLEHDVAWRTGDLRKVVADFVAVAIDVFATQAEV